MGPPPERSVDVHALPPGVACAWTTAAEVDRRDGEARTGAPVSTRRVTDAVVLAATLWLLRGFLLPAAWALVIAVSTWPLYRRFAQFMPRRARPHLTPFSFCVLVTLFVLGPLLFAAMVVAAEARSWYQQLAVGDQHGLAPPGWLAEIPLVGARLARYWQDSIGAPGQLREVIDQADGVAMLHWAQSLGQLVVHHALVIVLTIVMMYALYSHGDLLASQLARAVHRRFGARVAALLEDGAAALRAGVHSMVIVGIVDGAAMGVAYALVGVPSAGGWAVVTGVLATLPFAGYAAILTVCAGLLVRNAASSAAWVGAIGVAVLFTSDKALRPLLMGNRSGLSFLGALLGGIGGLATVGLIGVFVGPAVVALGVVVCREWLHDGEPRPSEGT